MEKDVQQFIWQGIDLEAMRQVMDKPADDAVTSLFQSGSMDHLRSLLVEMAKNDSMVPDQLPEPMKGLVASELSSPFTPKDIELFTLTHEIWKEKGLKFIFILFFRALPYTYMAEKPAKVLKMTKLLVDQPERRIFETAQFVFDVMDEHWWEPEKRGILTALKVRLMHAAIRHIILNNNSAGGKWNDAWGKPISQEDLVATNQVFSLEFFKGLSILGDALSPEEQNAWYHTWKTIGKIMGVQDELISKNVEEAWTLQHEVYDHLFRDKAEAGIALTRVLVETMNHFHLPVRLTLYLMKKMLADEQYPDCFERILGPSYEEAFPDLFAQPQTEEEKKTHKMRLHQNFHDDLKEFHSTLLHHQTLSRLNNQKKSFWGRIKAFFSGFFAPGKKQKTLMETHVNFLEDILKHLGLNSLGEELEEGLSEEIILKFISSLGGIIVSILATHFREDKQTRFRIPENLRDLWSIPTN